MEYPPPPTPEYPPFEQALEEVMANGDSFPKCKICHKTGFYYPADKAYAEGHCYSKLGMIEFTHMTGYCEWCFDNLFKEEDD